MAKKTSSRTKSTPDAEAPVAQAPAAKAAAPKAAASKSAAAPKAPAKKAAPKKSVTAKKSTPVSAEVEPTDEEIRVRAYHRYLERGADHGMDFEDWLEAKRELQNSRG